MPAPANNNSKPRNSAYLTTAYIGLLCIAGNLAFYIYPVFVTSIIGSGQATAGQIGALATAEFLPFGLAIIGAGRFLPARHLRLTAGICLIIQMMAAFLSAKLTGDMLSLTRAVYGVASGILIWLVYEYAARAANVDRLVAIYTAATMIFGVIFSWVVPDLFLPILGHQGVILFLTCTSLPALLLLPFGPNELAPLQVDTCQEGGRGRLPAAALLVLFSIAFWSAFGTTFWVYAEPLSAVYADRTVVSHWLAISLICQIAGAALSSVMAERLPYKVVVTTILFLFIAQVVSLLAGVSGTGFVIWTGIYGFVGFFVVPFFIAALVDVDPSRRSVVFYPASQMLASSLGPVIASQLISDTDLKSGLIALLVEVVIAPVLFWLALLNSKGLERRTLRQPSKSSGFSLTS